MWRFPCYVTPLGPVALPLFPSHVATETSSRPFRFINTLSRAFIEFSPATSSNSGCRLVFLPYRGDKSVLHPVVRFCRTRSRLLVRCLGSFQRIACDSPSALPSTSSALFFPLKFAISLQSLISSPLRYQVFSRHVSRGGTTHRHHG